MSNVICYHQLVDFLKNASLFEIYRLSTAISNELESPTRIATVRKKFKEGDFLEYFNAETNKFIAARAMKKNTKYVVVQRCDDGSQWKIPYHFLKIDARHFDFSSPTKGLNKNELKVGDWVGFDRSGEEVIGCVERLNHKTVSLVTSSGHRWRVGYSLLYRVIEGQPEVSMIGHAS
ncbi:hypothetical protein [Candidiatus Paracoxiella cheracis]|uniref:hypothetical protein n=1 Tax=Candidiatus Paracoxiella cheracis TaxID=3405120 RepID=UPI003BF5C916